MGEKCKLSNFWGEFNMGYLTLIEYILYSPPSSVVTESLHFKVKLKVPRGDIINPRNH